MDPTNFCYWLHGFSEITNGAKPDDKQWKIVVDELNIILPKSTSVLGNNLIKNNPVLPPMVIQHPPQPFSGILHLSDSSIFNNFPIC